LSGTTQGPQTTKELLDIATSHASGEEAIGAIFDRSRGKAKQDEGIDKGTSNRSGKKRGTSSGTRPHS
jgi:hypothetical protein